MNEKNYSITELASDRGLWEEYIDPNDNGEPFATLTQDEREALIKEVFGQDFDDDGNPIS